MTPLAHRLSLPFFFFFFFFFFFPLTVICFRRRRRDFCVASWILFIMPLLLLLLLLVHRSLSQDELREKGKCVSLKRMYKRERETDRQTDRERERKPKQREGARASGFCGVFTQRTTKYDQLPQYDSLSRTCTPHIHTPGVFFRFCATITAPSLWQLRSLHAGYGTLARWCSPFS